MNGVSPSGKASAFGADIRWFESSHPSQTAYKTLFLQGLFFIGLCHIPCDANCATTMHHKGVK